MIRSASANEQASGSQTSPNTSTNRQSLVASLASSSENAAAAAVGAKSSARKSLLDSGVESSGQTTSYNDEAQRLLDSGGLVGGNLCNCCDNTNCQYRTGPIQDQRRYQNDHQQHPNWQQQQRIRRAMEQAMQQQEEIGSMSLKAQTLRLLPAYFVAELVGTFLLVLIGDGAIASYVFTNRPVDPFSVCLAFGVGAMIASYVSIKLSGAHLNPAATLAFALDKRLKWELVPVYIVAQYIGGFLAALVLFLNYTEAINSIDGGEHTAINTNTSTGGIFATYPAPFVTVWGSLIDQVIGTGVLLFCLSALSDKRNLGLEDRFQPPIVALAVGLVCFAFNVNCGAIFNPARDLSPRILTALLGYQGVWEPVHGTYWFLAGIIGPHIGAIVGVFAYKYLIGTALEATQRHLDAVLAAEIPNESGVLDSKPIRLAFPNPNHGLINQVHKCDLHYRHHNHNQNGSPKTVQRRSDVPDYGSSTKQ